MVFDALPLSYGGDIVLDSTPFNVQLDGRGLPGWMGGWVGPGLEAIVHSFTP